VKGSEQGSCDQDDKEKIFCSQLGISMETFKLIKDKLVSESEKHGKIGKNAITKMKEESLVNSEIEKMNTVFDFLVKQSVIKEAN